MKSESKALNRIAAREWVWLGLAAVLILTLTSLPILSGFLSQSDQAIFSGGVFDRQDYAVHLGAMRLGERGEWAYRFLYTTEDHEPGLTKLGYLLLGKLAGAFNLSLPLTYHLSRVLLGAGVFAVTYAVAARAFNGVGLRRTAFLFASTASGLGWATMTLGWQPDPAVPPVDLTLIDLYAFYSIATFPHFGAVILLILAQGLSYLSYLETGRRWFWWGAVLAGLAMMPIQPFSVALGDLLAGGAVVASWRATKRTRLADLLPLTALVATQVPYVLYHIQLFGSSAAWAAFARQNVVLSPAPGLLALGVGVLGPLAIWGAVLAWRRRNRVGIMSTAWVAGALTLGYLPMALQRRFMLGLTIPLGLLATYSLAHGLMPVLRRIWPSWIKARRGLLIGLTVGFASLTNLYLSVGGAIFTASRPSELFDPPALLKALTWIGTHGASGEAVMASGRSGWLIPAATGLNTYVGHPFETLDFERKVENAEAFFGRVDITADEREQLLRSCGCDWVLFGPYELAIGDLPSLALPNFMVERYRAGKILIFRVSGGES